MPLSGPPLAEAVDLSHLLRRGLDDKPDELALISAEGCWTWCRLDRTSDRLARHYLGLGLKAGDRVASLVPNCCELIVHYIACLKAGLVATPLNYRYAPPEIDHALALSEASILVSHAERRHDIAASKLVGKLPLGVIWYKAEDTRRGSLEELIDSAPPTANLPRVDPDHPAFIFFTSGSTGPAKGVTHSARSLGWIAASMIAAFETTSADAFLTASSLSHAGGVGFSLMALAAGARVVVGRNGDADELLPLLRTTRATIAWILPAALFRLIRDHGASRADFASLRYLGVGGDKAPAELERAFERLTGYPLHESYGMTEFGAATANPPRGVDKPGSIGPLCPGFSLTLRDEGGGELPPGAEGRLWIASPGNMIGYWNNKEATDAVLKDGWLDTGDVMQVDDDGYLWFRGRKKQIIVHDGSNICPQEVEEALLAHPAVKSAGVIGVHDLMHGENVRAYITLKDTAARPASGELIRFARQRIGYKAPEEIVVLSQIPLTPVGKIDRTALVRMAEENLHP